MSRYRTDPSSKASACLAVLADGPATTGEIAAETGMPSKLAGTHLRNLYERGKVKRERFVRASGRGRRVCWLWSVA